jgi:hypothetical protein
MAMHRQLPALRHITRLRSTRKSASRILGRGRPSAFPDPTQPSHFGKTTTRHTLFSPARPSRPAVLHRPPPSHSDPHPRSKHSFVPQSNPSSPSIHADLNRPAIRLHATVVTIHHQSEHPRKKERERFPGSCSSRSSHANNSHIGCSLWYNNAQISPPSLSYLAG